MWRIVIWGAAAVMIVLGLMTLPLPVPTGVPLLAGGAMLVLSTSPGAARWLRRRRRGSGWLNRRLTWLEQRAPLRLARIIGRSRPRQK